MKLRAETVKVLAGGQFENLTYADISFLRYNGDKLSHEFLMQEIAAARPGDKVLSEEGADDGSRLGADRVWIVDPLDGTREFGEVPRDDWAVHVALWERGVGLSAGAVSLPARDITLSTAEPVAVPTSEPPAEPPTEPPATSRSDAPAPPRIVASRSRPGPMSLAIADALGGELLFMGSAGAKAMSVVLGDADIYAHTGGQYEWDSAAPAAVALSAGLSATRIDGSPLIYNRPDPYLPDLLICRAEWAEAALSVCVW